VKLKLTSFAGEIIRNPWIWLWPSFCSLRLIFHWSSLSFNHLLDFRRARDDELFV